MAGRLAGRIALVTGASRGIGFAIARTIAAAKGAHVVALARTVGGLEELDDAIRSGGGTATLVPADLKDYPALDRLGAALFERFRKLDILIGNGAILGKLTPLAHADPKLWDEVMAVNVTANWRLIRSLDLLLRQSDNGRAIFVTSGAARRFIAYWGPMRYRRPALEALVKTYAAETLTTDLRVNLVNPGIVRTRMRAEAMPGEDPRRCRRPRSSPRRAASPRSGIGRPPAPTSICAASVFHERGESGTGAHRRRSLFAKQMVDRTPPESSCWTEGPQMMRAAGGQPSPRSLGGLSRSSICADDAFHVACARRSTSGGLLGTF